MMGLENPIHIVFILAIVLMVFGAKRLPEMGRGLGEGFRGFRSALNGSSEPAAELGAPETPKEPTAG